VDPPGCVVTPESERQQVAGGLTVDQRPPDGPAEQLFQEPDHPPQMSTLAERLDTDQHPVGHPPGPRPPCLLADSRDPEPHGEIHADTSTREQIHRVDPQCVDTVGERGPVLSPAILPSGIAEGIERVTRPVEHPAESTVTPRPPTVVDIDLTATLDTDRRERALTHDTHPLARPNATAVACQDADPLARRLSGRNTCPYRRAGSETS